MLPALLFQDAPILEENRLLWNDPPQSLLAAYFSSMLSINRVAPKNTAVAIKPLPLT
jgi:hypothetical protein